MTPDQSKTLSLGLGAFGVGAAMAGVTVVSVLGLWLTFQAPLSDAQRLNKLEARVATLEAWHEERIGALEAWLGDD